MSRFADFRSDTVTRPDASMRRAMAEARVGDDVFGDDPTIQELEARAATVLGKEAALFLPSGTMANQVAVRCHTNPGDEVLLHEGCHIFRFEQAGLAALHGVQAAPLPGEGGRVPVASLRSHVRPCDQHEPRTGLFVVENTHNQDGGRVLPSTYLDEVGALAREIGVPFHVDGARLLNASIALGEPAARLVAAADSVTLCLSKGLGAPAGTMLGGRVEFIAAARRARKLLGGGMRQVGILAAAGLLALADEGAHLARDHARARDLAEGLSAADGVTVIPPETNIVLVDLGDGSGSMPVPDVLGALEAQGVQAIAFGPGRIRFTTHRDVDDDDVRRAVDAFLRAAGRTP